MRAWSWHACDECGLPVWRANRADRKPLHPECAAERVARYARDRARAAAERRAARKIGKSVSGR